MLAFLSLCVLSFFGYLVFVAVGGPEWWEYRMRQTENVVETCFLVLWDYLLKPAVYWWTYPFLRTVVPVLSVEWENYRTYHARRQVREREARHSSAVDLRSRGVTFVDRTTHPQIVSTTEGKAIAYPKGRKDLALRLPEGKPKVRVKRHPPILPGSSFRYVQYTHEDGTVQWGVERIPEREVEVDWRPDTEWLGERINDE